MHAWKYQSVTTPNEMIANLFGPVEGKRHDCPIVAISGLLQTLQRYSHDPNGEVLCISGDLAYPLRRNLLATYNGSQLNTRTNGFQQFYEQS